MGMDLKDFKHGRVVARDMSCHLSTLQYKEEDDTMRRRRIREFRAMLRDYRRRPEYSGAIISEIA